MEEKTGAEVTKKGRKGFLGFLAKAIRNNAGFLAVIALILFVNWRYDIYYIQTGSMKPALEVGAVAIVDPVKEPKKGDIVAYTSGNYVIVHRVIEITDDGYVTKGDSNNITDGVIEKERIRGTMVLKCNQLAPLVRKLTGLPE